jgi:hypothetical protein
MATDVTPPRRAHDLDDKGRALLTELEGVQTPTPYARGALTAIRLASADAADRQRMDALGRKWGKA